MNTSSFEMFYNRSTELLAILDHGGYIKHINPAFSSAFKYPPAALLERSFWRFAQSDDQKYVRNAFRNLIKGHPVLYAQNHFTTSNGRTVHLRWSAYPDMVNESIYLIANEIDKSALDKTNFKMALESSPTCILIVQNDGKITYVNQLGLETFGYSQEEIIGLELEKLIPDEFRQAHKITREEFSSNPIPRPMGTKRLDLVAQKKDGAIFPVDVGLSPIQTPAGLIVICSLIDITLRVKREEAFQTTIDTLKAEISSLDILASTDPLTEINNRRAFLKQAQLHLFLAHKQDTPISLALLDVDNFKSYNDTYGHIAGDLALKTLAAILRKETRQKDISARYGGEEFAILMPGTTKDEASALAERIKQTLKNHAWPNRPITASIGLATYHPRPNAFPGSEYITQLIMLADEAMYYSKNKGKDRITHIGTLEKDMLPLAVGTNLLEEKNERQFDH